MTSDDKSPTEKSAKEVRPELHRSEGPMPAKSVTAFHALWIASVAAIGGFLFGFDSGVINGTVSALQRAFGSDAVGTGFSVASMLLGCAVGAFFAGGLADRLGRKAVMLVTAVLFAVSAYGSGAADASFSFVVFRMLGGLAVGAASLIVPVYIAEVSPAAIRGRLASLQQLAIVAGILSAFLSNYALAQLAGGADARLWMSMPAWRWMFWSEGLPALLFFFGVLWIPESPRFLVARGEHVRALKVLARVGVRHPSMVVDDIQRSLEGAFRPRLRDLLRPDGRGIRGVVWVGIALAMLQQLVGINVIFYYGAVLWQSVGFDESQALWTNVLSGAVNLVATFLAIALVDRVGRKPLLLVGASGMAVCLLALGWIFHQAAVVSGEGTLRLVEGSAPWALFFAGLYVVFFAATWGPVLWIMLGEMFANRFRGPAVAVAIMLHWLANFAVTLSFPWLLTYVGLGAAYAGYAVFAMMAFWLVLRGVRETRGVSLEEMQ